MVVGELTDRFAVLLEENTGLCANPTVMRRMARFLEARADAIAASDIGSYLSILADPQGADELQAVINLITVGKTDFARYPEMVTAVAEHLVPALDRLLPDDQTINIWSAGCSTGQEILTIAMALDIRGWNQRRRFRLHGTDINTDALAAARLGVYHHVRPRAWPDYVLRYVDVTGNVAHVATDIRERVTFDYHNLSGQAYDPTSRWHIVLCCNVLIYFRPVVMRSVVDEVVEQMAPDSALMLGGAETLVTYSSDLVAARFGDFFGYLRGTWNDLLRSKVVGRVLRTAPDRVAKPPSPIVVPRPVEVSKPAPQPLVVSAPAPQPEVDASTVVPPEPAAVPDGVIDDVIRRAQRLAELGNRADALRELNGLEASQLEHPEVRRLVALLLFNERRFEEAQPALDEAIATDPLAFDLHFYQGWILASLDEVDEALAAFRRALFLEPGFSLARYEFARILHKSGEYDRAAREYRAAAKDAANRNLQQRFIDRAARTGATHWMSDSLVVELCRIHWERAEQHLPVESTRDNGKDQPAEDRS